jgi:hypothetical protein
MVGWVGSGRRDVRGRHARRAEEQLAEIEKPFDIDRTEYCEHAIVVERLTLRLSRVVWE